MSEATETAAVNETDPAPAETFRFPNGQTEDDVRRMYAVLEQRRLEQRRKDPRYLEYVERTFAAAEEVRRQINAEAVRMMDEEEIRKNMEDSIFSRIASGEMQVETLYETDTVVAFKDISPQAPVHALVIPKKPIESVAGLGEEDADAAGALLVACAEVARRLGVDKSGFRVVFNSGADGGQTVPYLHAHVLGGRPLAWPPG